MCLYDDWSLQVRILFTIIIVGAPSIYNSYYQDLSTNPASTAVGIITCQSRYSPPTNITWQRDGVAIDINDDRYVMLQTVTDQYNLTYYDNVLQIMDVVSLAGNHIFTCSISNLAGSTSQDISTMLRGKQSY